MKKKLLGAGITAFVVIVGGIFWALNAWEYQQLGSTLVRRHLVRGIVEIWRNNRWESSFVVAPRAPLLTREDISRISISDLHWGEAGLLGATATITPGKQLEGRLAFVVQLLETSDGKLIRDRSLRQTISWPGGTTIAFVLPTDLFKPIRNQKTQVTLEPIE